MNRAKLCSVILALTLVAVCLIGVARTTQRAQNESPEAYAASSIYDRLTPEIIEIYEREISMAPVVSNKSAAAIQKTAQQLDVSVGKLKTVMLLQDLAARVGEDASLSVLADMSDLDLLIYAKNIGTAYAASIPKEKADTLKALLLAALKA